ncbi:MAG: 2-C-methyl-D-erythritol 4-phosphate cytidylyltransferase [Candidatus Omnitrophica bacterium]|nr:2-C-methyl-D-erythritol 4-phosphate cytidylyltransferase [Candidatus Omnitrophota bacterium]MDD5546553.1 2-C-methyl-D-erythritol 4-phosphate cytidylyltransferase [Candidatus Omnitrophota bacterium]
MKVAAIVAAAGKGERLKSKVHKPFVALGKDPILLHALRVLDNSNLVGEIIVVAHQADLPKARLLLKKAKLKKFKELVAGGKRRMDSVKNGLSAVSEDVDYVIIHDGCRPFIDNKMISSVLGAAETFGAAIAAMPVKPTIKEVEKGNFVAATLKRETLVDVQTPQAFRRDLLLRAYDKAFAEGAEGAEATDDSALVERMGIKVKVVDGSYKNIKITTQEDLRYAKMLMGEK